MNFFQTVEATVSMVTKCNAKQVALALAFICEALLGGGASSFAQTQTGADEHVVNKFRGKAYDKKGSVFLHTEFHTQVLRGGQVLNTKTTYKDANGKSLGVFKSDYSQNAFAPNYEFKDFSTQKLTVTKLKNKRLTLVANRKTKTLTIPNNKPLVMGQGLHFFVLQHFEKLMKGKKIKVAFAVPARYSIYGFRVLKLKKLSSNKVRIRVEIDSWVKRRLVDPIDLDYTLDGKLVRYKGISNFASKDGSHSTIVIRY